MHEPTNPASAVTFGVAGHVDHGKTAMVRALTGVETDRLIEEQRRGISIELGFAPITLQTDQGYAVRAALVDMPGHERFVRRMIAGAVGIDAVILVVAADDGVMPQAREHLAICQLLGVTDGIIVLSKVDLLGDGQEADELLELLDLAELCAGSFLADAPILRFSTRDEARWTTDLRLAMADVAARVVQRRIGQPGRPRPFRMPVDRAFHLRGRGTIVTGTAASGSVRVGDLLRTAPGAETYRVRSLERHGSDVESFDAPGRLAVNLAGAAVSDLPAGTVLAADDAVVVTSRFDAWLAVLPSAPSAIERRQRLVVHLGTATVAAAVVPLGTATIAPGQAGPSQIHLDTPIAVAAGERFVLRGSHLDARFGQTVAGGRVLLPDAPRHRLDDPDVVARLTAVATGDDEAIVANVVALAGQNGLSADAIGHAVDLLPDRLDRVISKLAGRGALRKLGQPPHWIAPAALAALEAQLLSAAAAAHVAASSLPAIDPLALGRRAAPWLVPMLATAAIEAMVRRGALVAVGQGVALPGFIAQVDVARPSVRAALDDDLVRHGLTPPTRALLCAAIVERLSREDVSENEVERGIDAMLNTGAAARLGGDTVIASAALVAMAAAVVANFADHDGFSTGDLKELLGVTRKHLIPLAEWMDAQRVTVRDAAGRRRIRARALEAHRAGQDVLGH
mgnify:CR=1 FL=1